MTTKIIKVLRTSHLMVLAVIAISASLSGCTFLASQGASSSQVESATTLDPNNAAIQIIPVTNTVALQVQAAQQSISFKDHITQAPNTNNLVGAGDILEVHIWEAYPPVLFRSSPSTNSLGSIAPTVSPVTTLPAQTVSRSGDITIPFIGRVAVSGKTTSQIESLLVEKLKGRANQPQVIVRMQGSVASSVTVVGEVGQSRLVPISPKGERVLDVIAAAGGVKQPVNKTTIQIARRGQIQALPMETIIRDPKQNIEMQAGDVVTAFYQPLSFTALGATGKNDEIMFEATGVSLSQAMGRVGGLLDGRADSKGVYIFRFEDPRAVSDASNPVATTSDGKVPVIYQFDMNNPATYFAAQNFPMKNKDVMYVSVASSVELMKFLALITTVFAPAVSINNQFISAN